MSGVLRQSKLSGYYAATSSKRKAEGPAEPARQAAPTAPSHPGAARALQDESAPSVTAPAGSRAAQAIEQLTSGAKLGSMGEDQVAALAEHLECGQPRYLAQRLLIAIASLAKHARTAVKSERVTIMTFEDCKMSDAAAAAQDIVQAGIFHPQLGLFSLPYTAGGLDADGCVSVTCSSTRVTASVMYAQSNPAAISMFVHTLAHHGVSAEHARVYKVHDSRTGRYTHGEKVHLMVYKQAQAAAVAAILAPHSVMKAKQLQLLVQTWPRLPSMPPASRIKFAADIRQFNGAVDENLNVAALKDSQGRPNWSYQAGFHDGDGTDTFQHNDHGKVCLIFGIAQPKSPAFLEHVKTIFRIGTVQNNKGSTSLQIRHREHTTTFLRHYLQHGHLRKQKILTLLTKEFGVSVAAIKRLVSLPVAMPDPAPLGLGRGKAYSTRTRPSTRGTEERLRLKEKDHFLASQWVTLLDAPDHRAPWSH